MNKLTTTKKKQQQKNVSEMHTQAETHTQVKPQNHKTRDGNRHAKGQ